MNEKELFMEDRVVGICRACGDDIVIHKGIGVERTICNDCFWTFIPDEGDYAFAPKGECQYCDDQRGQGSRFMPSHNASTRCRSGRRNHCTCDTCF